MTNVKQENGKIMDKMNLNENEKNAYNEINNIIAKYNDDKIVLITELYDYIDKYTFNMSDEDKLLIMKYNRIIKII